MAPVSVEENFKLLAAYCVTNGDIESVAKYMGITKNAVSKRFVKLTSDEKEAMEKAGILTTGAAVKKRAATGAGRAKSVKKVKKGNEEADGGEEEDHGPKLKEEDEAGIVAGGDSDASGNEV